MQKKSHLDILGAYITLGGTVMLKKTLAILTSLMIIFPLMAGGTKDSSQKNQSTLEKIKASGKIILGTSADYPPYEFHALIDGKDTIVGFDVDLAREIAKDLGVELEIKDMSFDGLLAALVSGNVDMVISGMTPTEERRQNVDFSDIYYQAIHGAIIRATDAEKYGNDPTTLKDVVIGAQRGAIQVGIAKTQIKGVDVANIDNNHPQVKELGALPDLILEVKNNKIEAVIAELPVASAYVKRNSDLTLAMYSFSDEEGGSAVAVKKGNQDLIDAINATIARLVAEDKINQFVGEASILADSQ